MMNEESLFHLALEQPVHERTAFLDDACGGNADLRQRVERLLKAHDNPGSFLQEPILQSSGGSNEETQALEPGVASPTGGAKTQTEENNTLGEEFEFLTTSSHPDAMGRLEHYHILKVIGRGGFGTVLKAFDEKLHRVVAIKVLSVELSASGTARQRFIREARTAAAVSHEHVVTIHAVVEEHRPPYLVMQLIDGMTLQQKLDKVGMLSLREILRIGMQTAEGLAAAHKQGLVHRDIKPANILLENGVERVKITDFGLARAVDDASVTQSGVVAGTPMYMSPEQANGETLDHRSDLFSLGTVLYMMCTGRPPFRATGTMAVLKRVIEDAPRPIREINLEIPDWLEVIVDKLHAKKPEDRYQTAKEVAELLGERLADVQAGREFERRAESRQDPAKALGEVVTPPPTERSTPVAERGIFSCLAMITLVIFGAICTYAGITAVTRGGLTPMGRVLGPFFLLGGPALLAWTIYVGARQTWLRWLTGVVGTLLAVGAVLAPLAYNRFNSLPPRAFLEVMTEAKNVHVEVIPLDDHDAKHVFPPQEISGQLLDQSVGVGDWKVIAYRGEKVHYQSAFTLHAGQTKRVIIPETPTVEPPPEDPGWVQLFNGKDLTGWRFIADSKENWQVRDGMLVGKNSKGADLFLQRKGSILFSERQGWQDFHLHMEAKLQGSGEIWIHTDYNGDWTRGLRVVFQSSTKSLTGSIRAHAYPGFAPPLKPASSTGDGWFKLEIVSVGSRLVVKTDGIVTGEVTLSSEQQRKIGQSGAFALAAGPGQGDWTIRKLEIKELPSSANDELPPVANTFTLIRRYDPFGTWSNQVEFTPDGKQIVSISNDHFVRVHEVETGARRSFRVMPGPRGLALLKNGEQAIVAGSSPGTVELWDLVNATKIHSYEGISIPHQVAVAPGERTFAVAADPPELWQVDPPKRLKQLDGHQGIAYGIAFSADGKQAATGGSDHKVIVWDADMGNEQMRFRGPGGCIAVAFNHDGTHLLTGHTKGELCLWDLKANKLVHQMHGHTLAIHSIALLSNGTHALTGSEDSTFRLWDLASGMQIAVGKTEQHDTCFVDVSPDGRSCVTAGGFRTDYVKKSLTADGDCAIRVWCLPESMWPTQDATKTDWVQLFNGKDVKDWSMIPPMSWKMENNLLTSEGRTHLWSSKRDYRDVHLRVEFKAEKGSYGLIGVRRQGNAGVAGMTLGDYYPTRKTGSIFQNNDEGNTTVHTSSTMDVPPDTWAVAEVVIRGNTMTVHVNGRETGRHTFDDLASDGAVGVGTIAGTVRVRKIEIKELQPTAAPGANAWTVVDVHKDSRVEQNGNRVSFTLPGKFRYMIATQFNRTTNAPRLVQKVEGDFDLRAKLMPLPRLSGNPSSGAGSGSISAGILFWHDDENFVTLFQNKIGNSDKGIVTVQGAMEGKHYHLFPKFKSHVLADPTKPVFLRAERRGSQVRGFVSEDGVNWVLAGEVTTKFPAEISAGVCASINQTAEARVELAELELMPAAPPREKELGK